MELCGLNELYSSRHSAIFSLASAIDRNQLVFRHSSRKLPLKDSIYALSVGFPGLEKSRMTFCSYAHLSKAFEINSLPLSTLIFFGTTPSLIRIDSKTHHYLITFYSLIDINIHTFSTVIIDYI
jgi:hypothetical protein